MSFDVIVELPGNRERRLDIPKQHLVKFMRRLESEGNLKRITIILK